MGNCIKLECFDFVFDEKLIVKEIEVGKEIKDGLVEGSESKRSETVAQESKKMCMKNPKVVGQTEKLMHQPVGFGH